MNMDFDREGFAAILGTLMPGVAKKEILAQTTHIILLEHGLATYNDNVAVFVPLEMPFTCSVPAKDFYYIINSCKGDEITLSYENDVLKVEGKDTVAEFAVTLAERKAEDLLNTMRPWDIDDEGWQDLPSDFLKVLKLVRFGAEKAMTQENMYTIKVDGDNVYTAGEHRVTRCFLTDDSNTINGSFLIPATVVDKMDMGSWTHIAVEDAWIHLKDEATGAIFSTRTIAGEFNDVDAILEALEGETGAFVEFSEELTEAISGLMVMFEETPLFERELQMEISENEMIITAKKGERSKVTKKVPVTSEVPFSFSVNPNFMLEVLELHNRALVFEGHGCLFQNEDESFRHFMAIHAG